MGNISHSKGFLIAVSILSAMILWLYVDKVGGQPIDSKWISVPVEFVGENDVLAQRGLMLTTGQDVTVRFRVLGLREPIGDINTKRDQFRVTVDLTRLTTIGPHTLDFNVIFPDSVSARDYTVIDKSPQTITVTVAEMSQKEIPIRCEIVGEVPEGYMADLPQLSPSTLVVRGQQASINEIDHAQVIVDMTGASETVTTSTGFTLHSRSGEEIDRDICRVSTETVEVMVPVLTIKEMPLVVNLIESPGSTTKNVKIFPSSVMVAGETMSISTLDSIILSSIDLKTVMEDTTLEVPIPLPANSRLIEGEDTAQVTIHFEGLSTRTVNVTNITTQGELPEGQRVSLVTRSMGVTLRGPAEELEAVEEYNVRIVADLSNVNAASGTYTVPAAVYVDDVQNVGAIGEYQVMVRIRK